MGPVCVGLGVGDLGVWNLGEWDLGVGCGGSWCVCGRPGFGGHGCVQPVLPFRQEKPCLKSNQNFLQI